MAKAKQTKKAAPANANPGPVDTDPIRAVLASRPITEKTELKIGDEVQIQWSGQWWAGEVVDLEDNGMVHVHYVGWDDSWDETVPRNRLCLASPGAKTVAVLFDNGQTITGTLLGTVGEFLLLLRDDDRRTLVNRQRILYVDVQEGD